MALESRGIDSSNGAPANGGASTSVQSESDSDDLERSGSDSDITLQVAVQLAAFQLSSGLPALERPLRTSL